MESQPHLLTASGRPGIPAGIHAIAGGAIEAAIDKPHLPSSIGVICTVVVRTQEIIGALHKICRTVNRG
jgi:hypothetical protein